MKRMANNLCLRELCDPAAPTDIAGTVRPEPNLPITDTNNDAYLAGSCFWSEIASSSAAISCVNRNCRSPSQARG